MKAFLELGVLCLFVCLTWAEPVTVECNLLMLRVFVKKDLFQDGYLVTAEELTLGTGCPVNRETADIFELHYGVTECGIEFEAFDTHVIYRAVLRYFPLDHDIFHPPLDIPLLCQVPRIGPKDLSEWDTSVPSTENPRKGALRMYASECAPTYWTPELRRTLRRRGNKRPLKKEVESRNWVSLPILTLSI